MNDKAAEIILVTPVWNDSHRLSLYAPDLVAALRSSQLNIRWVISDDGSGEEECKKLTKLKETYLPSYPDISTYFCKEHKGKGATVRAAWEHYPDAEWFAFVDADGSISGSDIVRLIRRAREENENVIGIRKNTEETRVEEHWWRGLRHRGFLLACKILMGWETEDSQCGAKVLRGEDFREIYESLEEDGFAFDVELLSALHSKEKSWHEEPINWVEKGGSKLRPLDSWHMLRALFRIRKRF